MKTEDAFPEVFTCGTPKLSPGTPVRTAISVLLAIEVTVLPIDRSNQTQYGPQARAISGYLVISQLVDLAPREYDEFLAQPSENIALAIGTVSYERDDIESLLHVFESSTFGYAEVSTYAADSK